MTTRSTRCCINCHRVFPLTREFFGQTPNGNFRNQCRECKRAYNAEWARRNPDLIQEKWTRQNAKRAAAGPRWTQHDEVIIRAQTDDTCTYCGVKLNGGGEIDHILSLESGGDNRRSNLTPVCLPCNRAKGARNGFEFIEWRIERGLKCSRLAMEAIQIVAEHRSSTIGSGENHTGQKPPRKKSRRAD